jgi:hypothetical protein
MVPVTTDAEKNSLNTANRILASDSRVSRYIPVEGLVAGLPLICIKGGALGYKATGRSIHDSNITINTINLLSCIYAPPVNLDTEHYGCDTETRTENPLKLKTHKESQKDIRGNVYDVDDFSVFVRRD